MAGRPGSGTVAPAALRSEVLKELQILIDDRDARDRLDDGPLAEAKGREHWLLHLLLRAHELGQAHVSNLVGTSYANLLGRLQSIEDAFARIESVQRGLTDDLSGRLATFEQELHGKIANQLGEGRESLTAAVLGNLEQKWKPISESIETFARASHQLSKDISDTYRVATQTRLLLNENARRMTDLGRDTVALEEGIKLAVGKLLEERFQALDDRLAALESRLSVDPASTPTGASTPPATH